MHFGLLGTLEVLDGHGGQVEVTGGQPRLVLATLLAAEGRAVPADALIDALWGDAPPASAANTLQSYISRLRRLLEPDRAPGAPPVVLVSEGNRYRLDVAPDDVDLCRFERLAEEGHHLLAQGRTAEARERLGEALELWRGPALVEFLDRDVTRGLAARLEERRIVALEDRVEADLVLGRHSTLVGELSELVEEHPLREHLRGQLTLALYRSGRQAEALRALDDARRTLVEELGVEPGRALQELGRRILEQDPTLDVPVDAGGPPPRVATGSSPRAGRPDPADDEAASRLVGRRTELDQSAAVLDEARAASRVLVIEGQPGIGKTRLAEEVAAEASRRGALVLWGRSLEGEAAPAFWPWLGVLRPLVTEHGSAAGARLGQLLGTGGATIAEPGGTARFELFDEIATALGGLRRELVVILDDIQWADLASLELLGFLAGRLRDEPVLLVVTVRELEVGRNDAVVDALASIARRPHNRRIRLRGLDVTETGELLQRVTGSDVPAPVVAAIHARADGNPFYATELARLLAEADGLTDPSAATAASVPAGVRDVVRQRLARLPAATAELLQVCAVIGREADLSVVSAAADISLDGCLTDLEPAVLHRLLIESPDLPGSLRFAHALVREVVLGDISSLRRARLHLRVADAVEAVAGTGDDVAEILAEHLWAASAVGVGRRAADALERAGGVAVRRMGYEAAEDLLGRCVHLRRAAGATRDDARAELRAILDLLGLRRARHGYAVISDEPLLERGRDLARLLEDSSALLAMLYMLWSAYDTACRYDEGTAIAEQIATLGRGSDDPTVLHFVNQVGGIHSWHLGRIREARDHLDVAASIAPQPREHTILAVDAEMWMLANAFAVYMHDLAGDQPLDVVERRFEDLIAPIEDPFAASIVYTFAAAGGVAGGDPQRSLRWGQRALQVPEGLDFAFWNGTARAYLGAALVDLGRHEEGLPLIEAGARHCLEHGARTNYGAWLAIKALGEVAAQRLDDAAATLDDARRELAVHGERWPLPILLEAEAVLAHANGAGPEEVAKRLESAAEEATDQGSLGLIRRLRRTAQRLDVEPPQAPADLVG